MIREMLEVLMDGIKDSNMLLDYCSEADASEEKAWFKTHARNRVEQLVSDYQFIRSQIGLEQKVKEGDAIAEALESHLEHEINSLRNRIS